MVNIAILLPFNEKDLPAKEYAKMIKLGLSDSIKAPIKVTHYDATTEENLASSVTEIIDNGTDIIIGPITSQQTKYVTKKVASKNIITFSLANNPTLAGKYSYIFGHQPMTELNQAINYLLNNNYQYFITLLPFTRQDKITAKILASKIKQQDKDLLKTQFYQNTPEDIKKATTLISNLVNNLEKDNNLLNKPVILLSANLTSDNYLYQQLKLLDLDRRTVIIGDNHLNTKLPINLIFTGSRQMITQQWNDFLEQSELNYSSLHAIAYDAGKIIGGTIGKSYKRNIFMKQLNAVTNFTGLSGYITLNDHIANRTYDLILKEDGEYIPLTNYLATNLFVKTTAITD